MVKVSTLFDVSRALPDDTSLTNSYISYHKVAAIFWYMDARMQMTFLKGDQLIIVSQVRDIISLCIKLWHDSPGPTIVVERSRWERIMLYVEWWWLANGVCVSEMDWCAPGSERLIQCSYQSHPLQYLSKPRKYLNTNNEASLEVSGIHPAVKRAIASASVAAQSDGCIRHLA